MGKARAQEVVGAGVVSLSPGTGNASRPSPLFPRPMEAWFSTFWYVLGWVVWTRARDQGWGQGQGSRAQEKKRVWGWGRTVPPAKSGYRPGFRPWQGGEAGPEGQVTWSPIVRWGAVCSPSPLQGQACCPPKSLRGAGGHPCSVN